jgi:hypothetical protein
MKYLRVSWYALLFAGIFLAFITASGCSQLNSNPQVPDSSLTTSGDSQYQDNLPFPGIDQNNTGRENLGQWTADLNISSLTATVEPDRSSSDRYNVTSFFLYPSLLINGYDPSTGIINVDVTLNNIYPVNGYDLRLIIFSNAGHQLKNADSWTSAYDLPGGLPINPFKAYAKSDPERMFRANTQLTENLKIYLPSGNTNIRFAVDVAFPSHSAEPYWIDNFHQETLLQDIGSTADIWIEVYDWQDDISSVSLYCPDITGTPYTQFTPAGNNLYESTITNSTGMAAGDYPGVIVAYSAGQALYDFIKIRISKAQNTIGLIRNLPGAFDGYTLYSPQQYNTIYLIDMNGDIVHVWRKDYLPNGVVYLLENGNILHNDFDKAGANGGGCEEIDWDSNLVWEYQFPPGYYYAHHDLKRLPNGNTIFIVWEPKSLADVIAAGRDPSTISLSELWTETLIEVKPTGMHTGDIVWEWRVWNHLSSTLGGVADGVPVSTDITDPGKFDINLVASLKKDWLHFNALDYNAELDQIMVSNHNFSEVTIIDHSTANYDDPQAGIEAAKGPAGDILYRWGNPMNYGAGTLADRKITIIHDTQWIKPGLPGAGNILFLHNGSARLYSSVEEFIPPVDEFGNYTKLPGEPFAPDALEWIYTSETLYDFYSAGIGGAQRLPNGNTLICSGTQGWFFEVTPDKRIIWEYINPVTSYGPQKQGTIVTSNDVFRCYRYPSDYPAFAGKDLTPQKPVELPPD